MPIFKNQNAEDIHAKIDINKLVTNLKEQINIEVIDDIYILLAFIDDINLVVI